MMIMRPSIILTLLMVLLVKDGAARKKKREPTTTKNWLGNISMCGCKECSSDVLNIMAGGATCLERVLGLIFDDDLELTEEEACIQVTKEYEACGPGCDPLQCDGREPSQKNPPTSSPTISPTMTPTIKIDNDSEIENAETNYCDCESCTTEVWDRITDQFSCGARISWLLDVEKMPLKDACHLVSGIQFPAQCSPCDPQICQKQTAPPQINEGGGEETVTSFPDVSEESSFPIAEPSMIIGTRCGCSECIESLYSTQVDGHSLSDRIDFLLSTYPDLYPTEEGACRQIFQVEFPGLFFSDPCDPDRCDGQEASNSNTSSRNVDLYCFPPYEERSRFEQVWDKYSVHIKEGSGCGPSNNFFSSNTVTLENSGNDLKLQFKKVKESWEASEVRILLPDDEAPYHYGNYSFSVKSVQVYDSINGSRVGDKLPPSLVFGLFTWDPTEDYVIHENYNHEVDVEISRWNSNDSATPDAQFLVQPPLEPQMYRFFTGPNNDTYYQSSRTYSFDWEPAKVTWHSNAGSGHRFQYSTKDTLQSGQVDYIQCMPANVEVRINLWNLFGNSKPVEMEDSHVVEVVIDNFQYIPSGKTHVADGGTCSKGCQCSPTSTCIYNQCMQRQRRRFLSGASTSEATKLFVGEDKPANFGLEASLLVLAGCAIAVGLLTLLHPATK